MPQNGQSANTKRSWFTKWFLNNRFSVILINILLTTLIIFMINQISYIFTPVEAFLWALFPPLLLAIVQYYLMNPIVDLLEQKFKINRIITIVVLFILVIGLLVWVILTLIPIIQNQINSLVKNWPVYWQTAQDNVNKWLNDPQFTEVKDNLTKYANQIQNTILGSANSAITESLNHIGSAINTITMVFMTVVTAPFVLFFMLKDGRQLKDKIAHFMPPKYRDTTKNLLSEINQSVAAYVRGQLTVAFWVGVMFSIGYSIIGLNYGLTLGIIAAILNLIPYFGTFIALIPAVIIALFDSTGMLIKVLVVFAIEQTIESRVVSPLVMGNKMSMHPITTILLLVGASAVFGLAGVIFAIPIYAIIKIILSHLFDYYRHRSGLYEADFEPTEPAVSKDDTTNPKTSQK